MTDGGAPAGPTDEERPRAAALIDAEMAAVLRRLLASMTFLLVVGIGIALWLDGRTRVFALGAVALKAGTDLARFRLRMRWLRAERDSGGEA